ncbi:MAG: hypothetical protein LC134_09770 [Chitinophagales bacterium]|nr:hypothetical protein [Chitinophagales bacterium]
MKKITYFFVVAICLLTIIYSCNKQSVAEIKEVQTEQASSSNQVQEITFDNYFTAEESEYLSENFGSFDLSTARQIINNGEIITTVCSDLNNDYTFKRIIIQEKEIEGKIKLIKAIYSVTSSNETISNILENNTNPTQFLKKSIVSLNAGEIYSVDENDNFTEGQISLRPPGQGFGTCFKTCYRDKFYGMNFVEAVICGYEIPACIATLSAVCAWDCR